MMPSLSSSQLKLDRRIDQLPWFISNILRRYFPSKTGIFHVIRESPLIILIPEDFNDDVDLWTVFFDIIKGLEVTLLCLIRGPLEAEGQAGFDNTHNDFKRHQSSYHNHRLIYLANNQLQLDELDRRSIPAILFNQNAIVDERLFNVMPNVEKKYMAIYNAQINPVKRHYLASEVDDLALITIVKKSTDESLLLETCASLKGATWLNFPRNDIRKNNYSRILQRDISTHLNSARVGLCLSKLEGAMFASIEYLLCGLPVISTQSFGGRDMFYDGEYTILVDANSSAVKNGVAELVTRRINGDYIREKTIQKINEHRSRLIQCIQKLCAANGEAVSNHELYNSIFPNQIYSLKKFYSLFRYT